MVALVNGEGKEERFTIEVLEAAAQEALAQGYDGPKTGKIRAFPDLRTLRYYTTLGLLDRPAELRGRTAYYGRRHLLQVVAIKRLQAQGRTLGDIQAQLTGQSDVALEALAQLPADLSLTPAAMPERPEPPRREASFWASVPAAETQAETRPLAAAPEAVTPEADLLGITLGDGAHLLFRPNRTLDAEEAEALRDAAAPLLALMASRGLWSPGRPKGDD